MYSRDTGRGNSREGGRGVYRGVRACGRGRARRAAPSPLCRTAPQGDGAPGGGLLSRVARLPREDVEQVAIHVQRVPDSERPDAPARHRAHCEVREEAPRARVRVPARRRLADPERVPLPHCRVRVPREPRRGSLFPRVALRARRRVNTGAATLLSQWATQNNGLPWLQGALKTRGLTSCEGAANATHFPPAESDRGREEGYTNISVLGLSVALATASTLGFARRQWWRASARAAPCSWTVLLQTSSPLLRRQLRQPFAPRVDKDSSPVLEFSTGELSSASPASRPRGKASTPVPLPESPALLSASSKVALVLTPRSVFARRPW